jgi:hypothetical protein
MAEGRVSPDGDLSEALWQEASATQEAFVMSSGENLAQAQTTVKVSGGENAFSFAFICAETKPEASLYASSPSGYDLRED